MSPSALTQIAVESIFDDCLAVLSKTQANAAPVDYAGVRTAKIAVLRRKQEVILHIEEQIRCSPQS